MRFSFAPRLEVSHPRQAVALCKASLLLFGFFISPSLAGAEPQGTPLSAAPQGSAAAESESLDETPVLSDPPHSAPAAIEEIASEPTPSETVVEEAPSLTSLLDALSESEDGQEADVLARRVQSLWNRSGSDTVDLLMRRASVAMRIRNFPRALDLLDTVITLEPTYAEAWNRRATVHYLRDDYTLSIADVQQVLRLEPRHFGALSGMGIMLDQLGQDLPAQMFLTEALKIHPFLSGARERLDEIERRLRGTRI